MKKTILLSLILITCTMLPAVFDDYQPSARARGMGGAFTGVANDVNAIFFNPAGLADTEYEAIIGMANLHGESFSQLKTLAAGAMLPKKLGTLGLGIRMLDVEFEGYTLSSEQIYTLSHGITLQHDIHSTINFGYNLNYYNLSFDDDDSDGAFGLDLGVTALLHTRTKLGFAITNLNKAKMGFENQIDLPSKMAMGISYVPYDRVTTSIEVKKDFAQETEFMGGVEARVFDPLSIRVGVHQNPATYSAGATFTLEGVSVDYAFTVHSVLAPTHYINLGYRY
ncbi:MAG: conjugal transfer protein TraF [Candidatus Cloacimonetes bacterium]|nr:conjugal transfer protein TraF [Candidatus Cloacimonadota bacterium]